MLLIIGAYRGTELVERAVQSLLEQATGIDRIVIVDDSGDTPVREQLAQYGEVVPVADAPAGYGAAMRTVCREAGADAFVFWEEDFILTAPVDFEALAVELQQRPHLAQIALLRGPHFPIEHRHGGLLEALSIRITGSVLGDIDGVIEQTGTFTCNPSVWAAGIAAQGWPTGKWSEDRKRDDLLTAGYRFGFLPGIRVAHDGQRSGTDY